MQFLLDLDTDAWIRLMKGQATTLTRIQNFSRVNLYKEP